MDVVLSGSDFLAICAADACCCADYATFQWDGAVGGAWVRWTGGGGDDRPSPIGIYGLVSAASPLVWHRRTGDDRGALCLQ